MECVEIEVTEKELEDWAERHMAELIHPSAMLLGRQITLPSGRRLDLLFYHRVCGRVYWTVVEMKAGEAGLDAVVQCLDYVKELRRAGYSNVTVRGVVAAEGFSQEVHNIVAEMQAMAIMYLGAYLTVSADPLYQSAEEYQQIHPPDVDSTKAREVWWSDWGAKDGVALRKTLGSLMDSACERTSQWRDPFSQRNRSVALVPASLMPAVVAYSSNGKH